ncbi:MAG: AAA family ATPase [Polyangiaceae bacterium]
MRIAISGAHRTGKSTLVAELAARLPNYQSVDEPYNLLEEAGHEFAHPPSLEDFEAQLERSLGELNESEADVLFNRCPLDVLAYLLCHDDAESFDLDEWLPSIREAMEALDLVVFVPIEGQDRIKFSRSDDVGTSRASVDEALREMVLDDSLDLGLTALEVAGTPEERARAVLRTMQAT